MYGLSHSSIWHGPQTVVHGSPYLLQEQRSVLQAVEQLLCMILIRLSGAASIFDISETSRLSCKIHPQFRARWEAVNVHEYEYVGCIIIHKMKGQPAFTFLSSRKDNAVTIGQQSTIKIAADRTIDSALLFQRFMVVSQTGELSLEEVMRYELSSFPPTLFEARNVFRKADKPQLAHAIRDHASDAMLDCVPVSTRHVLDVGSLIHRVPWQLGTRYGEIAKSYADFAVRHYGPATTVVFDGYEEGPSIKDNTHREEDAICTHLSASLLRQSSQASRKSSCQNDTNKQRLIRMISDQLRERDCTVVNAHGDAHVDIVQTVVETSL